MITFTYAQWSAFIASFLWPLVRILGFIAAAPLFGDSVPAQIKIGLGVALALLLGPIIPIPNIEPWSADGIALIAIQFIIGSALGFVLQIIFAAISLAGEMIGLQMGLGFASLVDPSSGLPEAVISTFFQIFSVLIFFSIDGHLMFISALIHSFQLIPIAPDISTTPFLSLVVELGSRIFFVGFMLSLPVIAVLMVTNILLGTLARTAPQLSLFSIGFPMTLLVGSVTLTLILPHIAAAMTNLFEQMLTFADQQLFAQH